MKGKIKKLSKNRCTIFIAILLIIGITAGNNYAKERQFAKL